MCAKRHVLHMLLSTGVKRSLCLYICVHEVSVHVDYDSKSLGVGVDAVAFPWPPCSEHIMFNQNGASKTQTQS